jgi:thiol-disulfide isomerase/thioredoxin
MSLLHADLKNIGRHKKLYKKLSYKVVYCIYFVCFFQFSYSLILYLMQNITNINEIPKQGRVILDFWAEWCIGCKQLEPLLFYKMALGLNAKSVKYNVKNGF